MVDQLNVGLLLTVALLSGVEIRGERIGQPTVSGEARGLAAAAGEHRERGGRRVHAAREQQGAGQK